MNHTESTEFADLLEAHLSGASPAILSPDEELQQAIAGHRALRQMLEETATCQETAAGRRRPPQLPDDYEIRRELGSGGMGVVYLVQQKSLNREVALKVLRPGEQSFGPLVRRFLGEARHLARLRHPHIVTIHEVGDAGGEPYFTMDFIDGESLSALLTQGPLSPTQALAIFRQVAAAVQHAHRQGIIHRDLKPANVLLDQTGVAYVSDFGLARDVSGSAGITQSGELLGTPQYMAPEQARGQLELIGEATDIHALGLLLFEMLTGRTAFASGSPADVLVRLLHELPPPLRKLDRRIPRDLETIVDRMLQKSAGDRYPNVSALLEDIRRFESGEPLISKRTGVMTRAVRWAGRQWKLLTTIASVALVASLLAIAVFGPLFDRSFESLVSWGDEELAGGNAAVAAQVYGRAWKRGTAEERRRIAPRLIQTCRNLDDAKLAVELAIPVVEMIPDASFGRYDVLIAQALVARERARSATGTIDIWRSRPTESLQLVRARLELAVAGKVADEERQQMEETLTAIRLILNENKRWMRQSPEYLYKLPNGTADELQTLLDGEENAVWDRARAAIALGQLHEDQGRKDPAAETWRRGYELVRRVYPMYSGVTAATGARPSRIGAPDAEECRLVRDLISSLRRVSPDAVPLPSGRVEFSVKGFELPGEIGIELVLELCDPDISDPDKGLSHRLPRLVPLRQDAPVSVGVLDGTYRLRTHGHHSRWDDSLSSVSRRIEVDINDWPEDIEVRGNTVQLPPVVLRLAETITLMSPGEGEPVRLQDTELVWQGIAGASRYQIQLLYTEETPSPVTHFFETISTTEPRLQFAGLNERQKTLIRRSLIAGRTGGWRVDAYDDANRRVGKSLEENHFFVAEGLEED